MSLISDRLDGIQAGVAFKAPVRCATTANITLSGEQTIDGIAVSENGSGIAPDRVLVKNQTNTVENGIYNVSTSAWTRAKDFDGARDVVQGTRVSVYSGTVHDGSTYQVTTANPVLPGTSNITFEVTQDVDLAADLADDTNPALGVALVGFDGGTLAAYFANKNLRVVNTIAALKALDKTKFTRAFVTGYDAAGDGGGGAYWYDSSDTTSTDNGGTIIVATDGGRWKLQTNVAVTLRQFGAKGDGVTNDAAAIQNAFDAGVDINVTDGEYLVSSTVTITTGGRSIFGDGATSCLFLLTSNIAAITLDCDTNVAGGGIYYLQIRGIGFKSTNVGARTSECGIRVTGSNSNYLAYCTFENLHFQGVYHGIKVEKSTDVSGEAHIDWNKFLELTATNQGANDCEYGIQFTHGSGTGNIFQGGNLVTATASIAIGDGTVNCGDLIFDGLHMGGDGTGIYLLGGSTYGAMVVVSGCQIDAGITTALNFTDMDNVKLVGNNWGGAAVITLTNCTLVDATHDEAHAQSIGRYKTIATATTTDMINIQLGPNSAALLEVISSGNLVSSGSAVRVTRWLIRADGTTAAATSIYDDTLSGGAAVLTNAVTATGMNIKVQVSHNSGSNSTIYAHANVTGPTAILTRL